MGGNMAAQRGGEAAAGAMPAGVKEGKPAESWSREGAEEESCVRCQHPARQLGNMPLLPPACLSHSSPACSGACCSPSLSLRGGG